MEDSLLIKTGSRVKKLEMNKNIVKVSYVVNVSWWQNFNFLQTLRDESVIANNFI